VITIGREEQIWKMGRDENSEESQPGRAVLDAVDLTQTGLKAVFIFQR
jgi:hypothetical protein